MVNFDCGLFLYTLIYKTKLVNFIRFLIWDRAYKICTLLVPYCKETTIYDKISKYVKKLLLGYILIRICFVYKNILIKFPKNVQ